MMVTEEVSERDTFSSRFIPHSKNLNLFALVAIVELLKGFWFILVSPQKPSDIIFPTPGVLCMVLLR